MSDEAPAKPPDAAPKPPGPNKAMLGIMVVNLAVTGLVAFKVVTAQPAAAATGEHGKKKEVETAEVTGPVVELDPFVVNLDEPGTARYLKMTLEVEVQPHGEGVLTKSKQLIRDTILSHLSGLRVKDTLGAEAKDRIRTDLMTKLSKLIGPDKIKRMFFRDFVVQ